MTDMSASIAAIQEFFVVQDRCRAAQANELCDRFLDEIAHIEGLDSGGEGDLVLLAELWPLLELRDAMTMASREIVNIDGVPTLALRKRNTVRGNPYLSSVTLVSLDAVDNAARQANRLAARLKAA